MEILGYISAVAIGLTLGLIGGGGSILTVPILVYLLGLTPITATAYSLFIVGLTALVGAAAFMQKGEVSYKTALIFAIPALIAVFATRKFIIPAIPNTIFTVGSLILTKDLAIMLLFAVLMLMASVSMIRKNKVDSNEEEIKFNYPMIFFEGTIVGILTGLVGAGGGFLIIPALVVFAKLPMKLAVGTSLLIIAAKSLIGFLGDLGEVNMDWIFLFLFSLLAVIGIFIGSYLSRFISNAKLKPAFGWFVLVMGVYIIGKEIFNKI